jgi:hypothetical protein
MVIKTYRLVKVGVSIASETDRYRSQLLALGKYKRDVIHIITPSSVVLRFNLQHLDRIDVFREHRLVKSPTERIGFGIKGVREVQLL